ncbi:zinc finger protein 845-like isoform X1 [Varroa jacobsoni]|uniref:zinc finger protein 845-like isoform X1 n=1 Tax=Varroa jacobsoni TaxID=62625 RepID=UPI000BF601E4|nr:zinc finger protein 845-like isoform X1 [Varroa jacobsoni]
MVHTVRSWVDSNMDSCVRLMVRKQSSAFRLHLNEGTPCLSVVFVVDDSVDSINSDLVEVLQENQVPQGLKTVKETASLRVDTNLPQTQFRVEELVRSRQNPWTSSFICAVCRIETHNFQQLNIHYREHLVDGPLRCSYCERATFFQKLATFKEHLRSHLETTRTTSGVTNCVSDCTMTPKKFAAECEMCHKKFHTVKGLGAHRRTHKAQPGEVELQKTHRKDQRYRSTDEKTNEAHGITQQSERPATVRELLAGSTCRPGSNLVTKKGLLLTCPICNAVFSLQTKLESHMLRLHHEQLTDRCPQCDKVHLSISQLRNHILECHTAHFSFLTEASSDPSGHPQMSCNHCSQVYHDPVELLRHCKLIHSDHCRSLYCPHCGKKFSTQKRFANHLASKGNECARRPSCQICFRGFSSQKALADHMRSIHPQDGQIHRMWYCTECNEGYATKAALRYHIKAKHGSERFPCTYCDKTFALPVQRHRHESRVHQGSPKRYACNLCSMAFFTTRELLQHLLNGHKIVPDVNERGEAILPDGTVGPTMKYYACQHCSHMTYSRKTFIRHQASHTGIWPFKCDVCGKGFSERFQALKHVRVQHTVAPNNSRCDARTASRTNDRSAHENEQCTQSVGEEIASQAKDTVHTLFTSSKIIPGYGKREHHNKNPEKQMLENYTSISKATDVKKFKRCKIRNANPHLQSPNAFKGWPYQPCNYLRRTERTSCWRYRCRRCSRSFQGPGAYLVHRYRLCQALQQVVYRSCPYCPVQIVSWAVFQMHLRMHRYSDIKAYACSICTAEFSFESSLTVHIRQSHPEVGHSRFTCPRCRRRFLTEWSMRTHQKKHGQSDRTELNIIENSEELCPSVGTSATKNRGSLFVAIEATTGTSTNVEEVIISSEELLEIEQMDQQSV